MSDQTADESTIDDSELPESARQYLRKLEKEVRELRPVNQELGHYKLKEQLRTNGMDLSDKQLRALLASHEGEQTPEELRKTAEELKFVEPVPATDAQDEAAQAAFDQARNGAGTTNSGGPSTYEEEVANAKNMQELEAIAAKHGRAALERNG